MSLPNTSSYSLYVARATRSVPSDPNPIPKLPFLSREEGLSVGYKRGQPPHRGELTLRYLSEAIASQCAGATDAGRAPSAQRAGAFLAVREDCLLRDCAEVGFWRMLGLVKREWEWKAKREN